MGRFTSYFPILAWGRTYSSAQLTVDGLAAIIVTIMLIPQSLAYALLAGLIIALVGVGVLIKSGKGRLLGGLSAYFGVGTYVVLQ